MAEHLRSYASSYNLGHKQLEHLFSGPVVVQEKVDGCVSPDTRILMADLTYKRAGDLRIGDKLIAFEDKLVGAKLCYSEVTHTGIIQKECARVVTESKELIASLDHPWFVGYKSGTSRNTHSSKRWVETQALQTGDEILSLPTWETDNDRDAGYLAGFVDGEGTLFKHHNQRVLAMYQRSGDCAEYVKDCLSSKQFKFSCDIRRRKDEYKEVQSIVLRGGWAQILRFVGQIRPVRFIEAIEPIWLNSPCNGVPREKVQLVEHIGMHDVVALSTTSKTYIAEGLFSHNSQFSFGVHNGVLLMRSKGVMIDLNISVDGMFDAAAQTVLRLADSLVPGWTYRGEYLRTPKHNTLAYSRIPKQHIILFDVDKAEEDYLTPDELKEEAARLGLEAVPVLHYGTVDSLNQVMAFMDKESVLGGCTIEGMVFKNYARFNAEKKILFGKHVSEEFKEKNEANWKNAKPSQKNIIEQITTTLTTERRWEKAVEHLRDEDKLEHSPRDIGLLIREIPKDISKDSEDEIKQWLFDWAWPQIERGLIRGVPQWYKEKLVKKQFEEMEQ